MFMNRRKALERLVAYQEVEGGVLRIAQFEALEVFDVSSHPDVDWFHILADWYFIKIKDKELNTKDQCTARCDLGCRMLPPYCLR
jgi:hypothetical protein